VVDPAVRPDRRSFPKRTLMVLIAIAAGFLLGILVALVQAGWARLKEDPESSGKIDLLRHALRSKSQSA
jgi:uncharacterized protein involved in exopolysaccharide biosynthesis